MGAGTAPTNQGASGATGVEDNLSGTPAAGKTKKRQLLGGLLGGGGGGAGATGVAGLLGGGGTKAEGPPEARVAAAAGQGASSGLPTANADGTVDMTFRQVDISLLRHHSHVLIHPRSTKTAQAPSPPTSTAPQVAPAKPPSRVPLSPRTSPVSACRESPSLPAPSSTCRSRCPPA